MKQPSRAHRTRLYTRRGPSRIEVPETGVGPHVKLVFTEMKRQGVRYDDIEHEAGVLKATVKSWKRKNRPSLAAIEAVLGRLGWDFVPIPQEKAIPAEVVAALRPVADKLGLTMGDAVRLTAEIAFRDHRMLPKADVPSP